MRTKKIAGSLKPPRSAKQPEIESRDSGRRPKARADAAEWSVAAAKAKFSEVVASAALSPQTIKRNGKPVAVVVDFDEWQRKSQRKGSLVEFLLSSPLRGSGIDLERVRDEPRDIDL